MLTEAVSQTSFAIRSRSPVTPTFCAMYLEILQEAVCTWKYTGSSVYLEIHRKQCVLGNTHEAVCTWKYTGSSVYLEIHRKTLKVFLQLWYFQIIYYTERCKCKWVQQTGDLAAKFI